jgi:hypothetical protein
VLNPYAKIDGLIVHHLVAQPDNTSFGALLQDKGIEAEVTKLAVGRKEPFRVLDARLSAMKKKGLIKFSRTQFWQVEKEAVPA